MPTCAHHRRGNGDREASEDVLGDAETANVREVDLFLRGGSCVAVVEEGCQGWGGRDFFVGGGWDWLGGALVGVMGVCRWGEGGWFVL